MAKTLGDNSSQIKLKVSAESVASVRDFNKGVRLLKQTLGDLNRAALSNKGGGLARLAKELKSMSGQLPTVVAQLDKMANAIGRINAKGVNQQGVFAGGVLRGQVAASKLQNFGKSDANRAILRDEQQKLTQILNLHKLIGNEITVSVGKERQFLKTATDIKRIQGGQISLARQLRTAENQLAEASGKQEQTLKRRVTLIRNAITAGSKRIAQIKAQTTAEQKQFAEARAAATAQNRLFDQAAARRKKQSQQALNDLAKIKQARRNSVERVTGDGGGALLRIQTALLANFAILGGFIAAIRNAISFAIELDKNLRNLQAITTTSEGAMGGLRDALIEVSEATKFTANEVATAAVVLGQAGLSVDQIKRSIKSVTLLAAATGSDLGKSVDLITSILGVFNITAEQTAIVANTLTAAVNQSKLTLDKLALGLQFAGNIAAQSNVTFSELTAALGAMANAGIRSGSTLGTGTRQVLIALQKPSEQFKNILNRLGLTLQDVSIQAKGLEGVLNTLKDAGFTSADAIASLEVRAAAAFNALASNAEDIGKLQLSFLRSTAAAKANEIQMRSLANQYDRLRSVLGTATEEGLRPFTIGLRDFIRNISDAITTSGRLGSVIAKVTAGLVSFSLALVAIKLVRLVIGLAAARLGFLAFSASVRLAGFTLKGFALFLGPLGFLILGITVAMTAWTLSQGSLQDELAKSNTALETSRERTEKSTGAVERQTAAVETLEGRITELTLKSKFLTEHQDALTRQIEQAARDFGAMGLEVTGVVDTIGDLILSIRDLRDELVDALVIKIGINRDDLAAELVNVLRESQDAADVANKDVGLRALAKLELFNPASVAPGAGPGPDQGTADIAEARLQTLLDAFEIENSVRARVQAELAIVLISQQRQDELKPGQAAAGANLLAFSQTQATLKDIGVSFTPEAFAALSTVLSNESTIALLQTGLRDADERAEVLALQTTEEFRALRKSIEEQRFSLKDRLQTTLDERGIGTNDAVAAAEVADVFLKAETIRIEASREEARVLAAQLAGGDKRLETLLFKSLNAIASETASLIAAADRRTTDAAQDVTSEEIKAALKTQRRELRGLERRQGQSKDPGEIAALGDQILSLATVIGNLRVDDFLNGLTESDLAKETNTIKLASLQAEIAADLADRRVKTTGQGQRAQSALNAFERTGDLQALKQAFKDFLLETKQNVLEIREELKELRNNPELEGVKRRLAIISSPAQTGKFTTGEKFALQQRIQELERLARSKLEIGLIGIIEQVQELQVRNEINLAETNRVLLAAQIKSAGLNERGFGGSEEQKATQAEISELSSEQNKLEAERLSLLKQVNAAIREQRGLVQQRQIEEEPAGDFVDRVGVQIDEIAAKMGDLKTNTINSLNGVVSTLTNTFTTMFAGILEGTTSLKDGFKGMAISVIKSIQQIIVKMLIMAAIQKLIGFIGAGSGSGFQAPTGASLSAGPRARGGEILRMSAGSGIPIFNADGIGIRKLASGGDIGRDTQLALLRPGEIVLRNSAVQQLGRTSVLRANSLGNRVIAKSGIGGLAAAFGQQQERPSDTVNVWVVAPDQKPVPGPKDIVAIISDDIVRGGSTKQLIKSVQTGNI